MKKYILGIILLLLTNITASTTPTIIRIIFQDNTFSNHNICFYEKVMTIYGYRMNFHECFNMTDIEPITIAEDANYTIVIKEEKIFNILSVDSIATPTKLANRLYRLVPLILTISIILVLIALLIRESKRTARWR